MENNENLPEIKEFSGVPTIESYAQNLQAKLQMCKMLREGGFAPAGYKTDAAVLSAILYGQELGFSPIQSLHSIDVIQGKPTVNAQGLKAMIQSAGGVIKELEWTDKICRLEGNRAGNIQTASFSIQEATLMGLASKDNWKKMPKLMLYARAVSILARNQWADRIKGLYSKEEMQDSVVFADQLPQPTVTIEYDSEPQKDPNTWTGEEVITGGKNAGKMWKELSGDTIEWYIHNSKNPQVKAMAQKESDRRSEAEYAVHEKINEEAAKKSNDFDSDEIPPFDHPLNDNK